jgi:hypothetical protein
MIVILIVSVIYGALVVWNVGVVYAYFAHEFQILNKKRAERRSDFAFAVFWGGVFMPVTLFIALFTSGFYMHGWSFNFTKPETCNCFKEE